MNITVIGTGYVGLVSGTCLAELGMNVVCADSNEEKINSLKSFIIPIYEKDLESIIVRNYLSERLQFTTNIKEAIDHGDAIFIAVGTPSKKNGSADLKYIFKAAKEIAYLMESYKVIIIKSTVPIGTCQKVMNKIQKILIKLNKNIEFDIVSNPEFLREGNAISDFFKPDRIIIGTDSKKAENLMKTIYEDHIFKYTPFIYTSLETAEMIKYASNAFLATKLSFINEIANICELCNANIGIVAKGMGLDKRIGDKFLNPGPGFGGSCFPKDINALIKLGEDLGYKPKIIECVMNANLNQKKRTVKMIKNIAGDFKDKTFTVLGLAFKPETDDIRESPSVYIINALIKNGGKVKVYDPQAMSSLKKFYPELEVMYCEDEYFSCVQSDCIIVATEWEQFRNLDFIKIKGLVNKPVLIDLKNIYDPNYIIDKGFLYKCIGRK